MYVHDVHVVNFRLQYLSGLFTDAFHVYSHLLTSPHPPGLSRLPRGFRAKVPAVRMACRNATLSFTEAAQDFAAKHPDVLSVMGRLRIEGGAMCSQAVCVAVCVDDLFRFQILFFGHSLFMSLLSRVHSSSMRRWPAVA